MRRSLAPSPRASLGRLTRSSAPRRASGTKVRQRPHVTIHRHTHRKPVSVFLRSLAFNLPSTDLFPPLSSPQSCCTVWRWASDAAVGLTADEVSTKVADRAAAHRRSLEEITATATHGRKLWQACPVCINGGGSSTFCECGGKSGKADSACGSQRGVYGCAPTNIGGKTTSKK